MFEASVTNDCQSDELFLLDNCAWKADAALCSSTDSDSGCKVSEEPLSSAPDTESLLTFSSCNLSASEKMEDCLSETSTILASSLWKDQLRTTNAFLSPTAQQKQHWNSDEFKSNVYIPSEIQVERRLIELKSESPKWQMHSADVTFPLSFERASDKSQTLTRTKKYHKEQLSDFVFGFSKTNKCNFSSEFEENVSNSQAINVGNIQFSFLDKRCYKFPSFYSLQLNVCVATSGIDFRYIFFISF